MLRSTSGTTPPVKAYSDLPIHFQKEEIGFGVGFEPSFAIISYAFTGDDVVLDGAAYGSTSKSENASIEAPTVILVALLCSSKGARSGNLSLDKVMMEFMFLIDATPTCIRNMPLDDNDPDKGLTFKMTKLKYEFCYGHGKQKYTFECKHDPLDLVYQGLDPHMPKAHMPKAYLNKEDFMIEYGSESDEYTRSDPSADDGYNVVITDNYEHIFVYGFRLLWTLENRGAVWPWVGTISKAFEPQKPSPSRQYAQRKLHENNQVLDRLEMPQDDMSKTPSINHGASSPSQLAETSGSLSSPPNAVKLERSSDAVGKRFNKPGKFVSKT
ncbi:similar to HYPERSENSITIVE TO PI STARVATION 4 [Actinidia rufa]|uniref:Similar to HYPERSENSITIVE TO PI STARVATION 4 n=1 Tax=Actinidia rufa TaxID=165716 RepID=A0A7J0GFM7_9ERIC|nr:similar to HYPERSENSITIVE TO PI STARVATION 4 [Actinidia rufa]